MTGWIAPDGNFIECPNYQHFSVLVKHPIIGKLPKIVEMLAYTEGIADSCQALSEAGEHPEWHTYEIAVENGKYQMLDYLLDEGYIRVGNSRERMHFEGRPHVLKEKLQFCKYFAESYGKEYVFEPQKG